jgi:hypothetical protein
MASVSVDPSCLEATMHQIRSVSLCSYLDFAAFVGIDGHRLLKEAGIAPSVLDLPTRVPALAAVELLERSATLSKCDSFGTLPWFLTVASTAFPLRLQCCVISPFSGSRDDRKRAETSRKGRLAGDARAGDGSRGSLDYPLVATW